MKLLSQCFQPEDFLIRFVPALALLIALSLTGCTPVPEAHTVSSHEVAFWVWHRTSPVSDAELERLKSSGVSALYHHVANFSKLNSDWKWDSISTVPGVDSTLPVVPVIRIEAGADFASDSEGILRLVSAIRHHLQGVGHVQLDYDCPDRLLPDYAAALTVLKVKLPEIRLTVTALAGWIRRPGFDSITEQVDAIFPMFYDLEIDLPEAVNQGRFHPIAGSAMQMELIRAWGGCKIPWHAGLPNFARVSIFDSNGNLKGHLREWRWDELIFHPQLESMQAESQRGITQLRATQSTRLGNTRVEPGDRVVLRQPEWEGVREMALAAIPAGAGGVVWFRLPGPGEPNAWTVSHLTADKNSGELPQPHLTLLPDQRLRFENHSSLDIPPGFHGRAGKNDRGWKLEIDVPAPDWVLDAGAGDFIQMLAHFDPEEPAPMPVHVMRARRLTFWFSHLPAGQKLVTSAFFPAPGKDFLELRWRFNGGDWQPLLMEP